jgi:hypothetical protein
VKRWICIFFLIGCAPNNPIKHTALKDSLEKNQLTFELESIRSSMMIKTGNVKLNAELDSANKLIDKYQAIIKTEQPDEIELQILKAKIVKLKKANIILIGKINIINKRNEELRDSNLISLNKISDQQKELRAVSDQNAQLQESLKNRHENFKPLLSCVSVTPIGFNKRAKSFTTYNSKEVKRIEIRYIANPNIKDTEQKHVIRTSFLKAIGFRGVANTLIYNNDVDYKELITFENVEVFIPGDYLVKITIDDEQCYLSTLTLK